ncbi:hypothetical protein ACFP81_11115 [Deinococcus lacus]|uniref:Uncharacterized protein n=1 Tax=Deinococcus lacus TaxID=392561 RepID=A0ABW1YHZ8_9DEIO
MSWLFPADLARRSPLLPDIKAALDDLLAGRLGQQRAVQRHIQLAPLND